MLKPGDKIGKMTITEHAMDTRYPDIYDFCIYPSDSMEPGSWTAECEIPLSPIIEFNLGWGAKDLATTDANWEAMAWEVYIDGHPVDLKAFEKIDNRDRPDVGINVFARGWVIDLKEISPGQHTVRYSWKSDIPIDDGWNVYAPGTYEYIANFTITEE